MKKGIMTVQALALVLVLVLLTVGCGENESSGESVKEEIQGSSKEENTEMSSAGQEESVPEGEEESEAGMGTLPEEPMIDWKDNNLLAYLKSLLGITDRDIMLSDIQDITELNLPELMRLNYLDDLSKFPNLKKLCLNAAECWSLEPLANLVNLEELTLLQSWDGLPALPKLKTLELLDCDINAISLSEMPTLSALKIRDEWLTDVNTIASLVGSSELKTLELKGCKQLSDISGLADFKSLTALSLEDCIGISSIDALAQLPELTELKLIGCSNISSISGLSGMQKLEALEIDGCQLDDFDRLSDLPSLTTLKLGKDDKDSYCWLCIDGLKNFPGLTTLELGRRLELYGDYSYGYDPYNVLAELKNLETLDAEGHGVSGAVLAELTNLKNLCVGSWPEDSSLIHLPNLEALTITDYPHTCEKDFPSFDRLTYLKMRIEDGKMYGEDDYAYDYSVLSNLANLTTLDLSNSRIDLNSLTENLSGLQNLSAVILNRCFIEDASPLSVLGNVKELDLSDNHGLDLGTLSGMSGLTSLHLRRIGTDFSPLIGMGSLTSLDVGENSGLDLSTLAGLTNLTVLDVHECDLTDISALSALTNLTTLDLSGNRYIVDYSPVSFVPNVIR